MPIKTNFVNGASHASRNPERTSKWPRVLTHALPCLCIGALVAFFAWSGEAEEPFVIPIHVSAFSSPRPVAAGHKTHLLYELSITNFYTRPVELIKIEALSGEDDSSLCLYQDNALKQRLMLVGANEDSVSNIIEAGHTVIVFFDLELEEGVTIPAELTHKITVSILGKKGKTTDTLSSPRVAVSTEQPRIILPPLQGEGWVAFNGLSDPTHRRTILVLEGKAHLAQRFAIDWMQLGPDMRLYKGDPTRNSSYYSYGAKVLAVADARVASAKEGLPDNKGNNENRVLPSTIANIAGNYIILDLGKGQYALYAHLRPGSQKVKEGDTVKAGQQIAELGNTGNSDAPHLHFQLMDANSALASEGIPYEFGSFTQTGIVADPDALDNGEPWKPEGKSKPVQQKREFPLANVVVSFR